MTLFIAMYKSKQERAGFTAADGRPREATVTRPEGVDGPCSALLLVHGLATAPPDEPLEPVLARALAGLGRVVVHHGPRHFLATEGQEVDLEMERADAAGALALARTLPDVDPDRIFLLCLSLGGLTAPFEPGLAGVALWGSTARPWGEYMADNVRSQLRWAGWAAERIEATEHGIRRWCSLLETTEHEGEDLMRELGDGGPGISSRGYLGRSTRFWRQIVRTDAASRYLGLDCPVLSVRGSADCASHPEDHVSIIEAARSAGLAATGAVLDGLDHGLRPCPGPEDSYHRKCQDPPRPAALARIVDRWAARLDT
jgi:hypothetical protein